jgi:hypothetical protein
MRGCVLFEVVLIDFTLSRLITCEGELAYCDLESDPELFQVRRRRCHIKSMKPERRYKGVRIFLGVALMGVAASDHCIHLRCLM